MTLEMVEGAESGTLRGDVSPVVRRYSAHAPSQLAFSHLDNFGVLVGGPRALDKSGLENLLPAVQALNFGSAGEILGWRQGGGVKR